MSETRENMGSVGARAASASCFWWWWYDGVLSDVGARKKRVHIDTQSEHHSFLLFPIIDSQVFRTSNGEF